ncbi:hypothetical protein OsccyDRAFT_0783 [Leptolyngbyaceae cyanobacterium JSC-12]|nr:hypothetical protein OsccyDRAFT_0783 [Leptolyngbyaceae cyanobacterium JSC-12]
MKLKLLVRLKTAIAVAFWLSISTQVVFGQSLTQSVWFVPPERPTTLSLISMGQFPAALQRKMQG